ncbi:hypothetical protein U5A82_17465 [Sphingobium sp. CR2-8]|uniref:DUF6950 family protein n=1 Tax=Sphingobium sp. CR2-8 TaxID=1306534 RepID=UPI002DBBFEB4|nr:hypothetical protein [Sphingobium sp. CR2-8]MEC3912198.1 hypothetical protein [Sphingobium sp. CR2-8]
MMQKDIVDETLTEWRRGKFVYGQSDCMLSIGKYLARTGHKDVTDQFVDRYDTHEGAVAMMAAHGGVAGLMALAGAKPKDGPAERGDVVEVLYKDEDEEGSIGGICTDGFVAMRREGYVTEVRVGLLSIGGVWHGRP